MADTHLFRRHGVKHAALRSHYGSLEQPPVPYMNVSFSKLPQVLGRRIRPPPQPRHADYLRAPPRPQKVQARGCTNARTGTGGKGQLVTTRTCDNTKLVHVLY